MGRTPRAICTHKHNLHVAVICQSGDTITLCLALMLAFLTCKELPMAMPNDSSILPFTATMTAARCSHALPAIGSTIMPRNACVLPHVKKYQD